MLNWFKRRFEAYDLLLDYFKTVRFTWVDVAWGAGIPALAFIIPWSLNYNIPRWAIVVFFVWALFVAGYHSWRKERVRLIPQLKLARVHLQETPTEGSNDRNIYVQVEPKCLTDSPVTECCGHLLRVFNRCNEKGDWKLTEMKERLPLQWSHLGCVPVTLYPSGGQYLNVCFRSSRFQILIPDVKPLPSRWREVFNSTGTFRFDIEITSKDCPPVQGSVLVSLDGSEWNRPYVELEGLLQGATMYETARA